MKKRSMQWLLLVVATFQSLATFGLADKGLQFSCAMALVVVCICLLICLGDILFEVLESLESLKEFTK